MNSTRICKYESIQDKPPIIILARKGSKGLPRKNIKRFAGKPLITWSIQQGLASKEAGPVYVSSDGDEILSIAKQFGATIIRRPAKHSKDTSTSESGWLHALEWIEKKTGKAPAVVVALQVTSPIREPADIDKAIKIFQKKGADCLFSACRLDDITLWQEKRKKLTAITYNPNNRKRRQDRDSFLLENGSFYIFKSNLLRKTSNRLGGKIVFFEMPFWKSLEIDDKESFKLSELIFREKIKLRKQNQILQKPKLIIYDFDGVMTNNKALLTETGQEAVLVSRSDGWGIQELRKAGYGQVILSTEFNKVVSARAKKLGIEVVQGVADKKEALKKICFDKKIPLAKVLFVGNDLNDLSAMSLAGMTAAPADSHPKILKMSNIITNAKGGEGVVRELSERIIND